MTALKHLSKRLEGGQRPALQRLNLQTTLAQQAATHWTSYHQNLTSQHMDEIIAAFGKVTWSDNESAQQHTGRLLLEFNFRQRILTQTSRLCLCPRSPQPSRINGSRGMSRGAHYAAMLPPARRLLCCAQRLAGGRTWHIARIQPAAVLLDDTPCLIWCTDSRFPDWIKTFPIAWFSDRWV